MNFFVDYANQYYMSYNKREHGYENKNLLLSDVHSK